MRAGTIALDRLLAEYVPGSEDQPWTWDDEERLILSSPCLCQGVENDEPVCQILGHHQLELEAHLREHGLTQGVCLGDDGRVWDGHHRIVAARRLGIQLIPLESPLEAEERFRRDHPAADERIVEALTAPLKASSCSLPSATSELSPSPQERSS